MSSTSAGIQRYVHSRERGVSSHSATMRAQGGFWIHDIVLLGKRVLHKYLKSAQPSNLRRQLLMYGFKATKKDDSTGAVLYQQVDDLFKPGRPDLLDSLLNHARTKRTNFMMRRALTSNQRKKRPAPPPGLSSSDPDYSSSSSSSDEVRVREAACQLCVSAHKATAKTLDIVCIQAREIAELKKQIEAQGWTTRVFTRPVELPIPPTVPAPTEAPVSRPAAELVSVDPADADEPEWKRVLEEIVRSSDDSSMQLEEWMATA